MGRSEFDAHEGLKQGRRINPGPAKLPPKAYMGLVDVLFVGAALLTAAWFLAEFGGNLWTMVSAAIVAA